MGGGWRVSWESERSRPPAEHDRHENILHHVQNGKTEERTQTFEAFIPPQILHLPPKKLHQHLIMCPLFDSVQSWTISTFIALNNLKLSALNTCKGGKGLCIQLSNPQRKETEHKSHP